MKPKTPSACLLLAVAWALVACAGGSPGALVPTGDAAAAGGHVTDAAAGGADAAAVQCESDCDMAGATTCLAPGFRTCEDQGDGCLKWSPVAPCAPGESCIDGTCANCQNDCTLGAKSCGPERGVRTCVPDADDDACLEWSAETPCGEGETCSDGLCTSAAECTNECEKPGDVQCDGDAVSTCGTRPDDPCLHWGASVPCGEGESCTSGVCAPVSTCEDECQVGVVQCDAGGLPQICDNVDADSCLEWAAAAPCGDGTECQDGICVASCVDACADGAVRCGEAGVEACRRPVAGGCLDWWVGAPCPDGTECQEGACVPTCVDACLPGDVRCTVDGPQICGPAQNPDAVGTCADWLPAVPCDAGFICADGACVPACVDACAADATRCVAGGLETCAPRADAPCLDWSVPLACPDGQLCESGACVAACADECAAGGTRCVPGGVETCGRADAVACLTWGAPVACQAGQVCSNGRCAETCVDECPLGAAQCSGNGVQTCGNFDLDPCAEWGPESACPAGQVCSSGACTATCNDECADGSAECAGNGVRRCGQFDPDACLEWGPIAPCPATQGCSRGVCSSLCSDECAVGATRCGGAGVQICGQYDDDACTDWGPGVPCAAGEVCAGGVCSARCADECAAGAARCDGNGVSLCGQYDADACLEWSAASPCAGGEICADGVCQAPVSHCVADANCPQGQICSVGRCVTPRACIVNSNCPAGETCDPAAGVCRRNTPSGIGFPCAGDGDCGAGQQCADVALGGYCTQVCSAASPCPTGATCYAVDPNTPDQGICIQDCASAGDCAPQQTCVPTAGPLGGACVLAACTVDADCPADQLGSYVCQAGQCVPSLSCDPATGVGCDGGRACWSRNNLGFCLGPCNVLPGIVAPACGANQTCVPQAVDGSGFCALPGIAGEGSPCVESLTCGPGLACYNDGVGNSTCRRVCDTAASTCIGGQTCLSLGDRLGICTAPCTSECNAGDSRCAGGGTSTCGQADADVCLEYTPAVACAAGQTCSDLSGACEPACAIDADCANAFIPTRCVAGACRIQSQCNPNTGVGCVGAATCHLAAAGTAYGVCLQDCDPLASACPVGQMCDLLAAGAYCHAPGPVPAGGACVSAVDCAAGLACLSDGAGGASCVRLCDATLPSDPRCDRTQACTALGIGPQLGACVTACQDDCVLGSSACTADGLGTQTCGNFDADACYEAGPVVACAAGTTCVAGPNLCEAPGSCAGRVLDAHGGCPSTIYEVKTTADLALVVTVQGVVTAVRLGPGGTVQDFVIQVSWLQGIYQGPENSGVWVFGGDTTLPAGTLEALAPGQIVTVTATTNDYLGERELKAVVALSIDGLGPLPVTIPVTPDQIATGGPLETVYEGALVEVDNTVVTDLAPVPGLGDRAPTNEFSVVGDLRVDDQLYLLSPFPGLGEAIPRLVGVVRHANGLSKLMPRNADDVTRAVVPPVSSGDLLISEIDYDQPGTDTAEFVEIVNNRAWPVSLLGVQLQAVDGATGLAYDTYNLSNVGVELAPHGLLVVGPPAVVSTLPAGVEFISVGNTPATTSNLFQNGPDAVRIVAGDGSVIDGVAYEGVVAGAGEGNPTRADPSNAAGSLSRCLESATPDTGDNAVDFVLLAPSPGVAQHCH